MERMDRSMTESRQLNQIGTVFFQRFVANKILPKVVKFPREPHLIMTPGGPVQSAKAIFATTL